MKLLEMYKNARKFLAKEVRVFTSQNTASLENAPFLPDWFWTAQWGIPRGINVVELRQYAKSSWVQMAKRTIKNQIMTTEWDIVSEDEEDENNYNEDIKKVKSLLMNPNRNGDTFWIVFGGFLDDVMDLDSGVIWKGTNVAGELVELFHYDGSRFLKKVEEHGILEGYYQYSYKFPRGAPIFFDKKEIVYGMIGANTDHYPYGWSPLQSIEQEIEVMIQSTRHNKEFFKNNAIPDGLLSVPMDSDTLDRFKLGWEQQAKGKAHKLMFTNNADAKFTPLAMNNKDMEWLAGSKWYFHIIFAAYGLSPAEAGFYEDVNRSAQEGQERTSVRNAIRPYYDLIAEKINREIIPDIVGHDKIKFKWFPTDDQAEKTKHEQTMQKLAANVITINEVRLKEGLKPVDWGNKPMGMVMQDRAAEMNPGGFGDKEDEPKEKEEDKKEETDEDKDQAIKDFKKNFLHGAMVVKGKEEGVEDLPEELQKKRQRVIAIGPRGGRIVGYDSHGNPIYGSGKDDKPRRPKPKPQKPITDNKDKRLSLLIKKRYAEIPPKIKEKIDNNVNKFKQKKDTSGTLKSGGVWQEDRQKIHQSITGKYVAASRSAIPKDGKSKVVFMAGLPASGKTYATQNLFKKVKGSDGLLMEDNNGEKYIVLNADDIKQHLPEMDNGIGATLVHRESSELNSGLIDSLSNEGVNIIVDGTLAKEDKAKRQIDMFKEKGYSSSLIFVDVPAEQAINMAASRFKEEGRFVPYHIIQDYDPLIKRTVSNNKDKFDDFKRIENIIGQKPQVVESS